ncbi:MAG TPA: PilC/PilY family type IV pilus protein [Arenimonas sp.]|nr:PilC/PilY family type IV pilus protein [Arenimonas sp.]
MNSLHKSMQSMEARHAPHPLALALGIACSLFFVSTVQAGIVTPNSPLQTGTKVPPNIMLMLDDSGSMAETNMDDPTLGNFTGGGLSGSELSTMQLRAYANNSIFYNPAETYLPWRLANGTRMASTPYTAVYTDTSKASGSTTNLTTANQEVYYPINPALETTNAVDYYRYRFKTDGTADRCQRTQVLGVWGWNACVTGITSFTWTTPTGPVTRTLAQEKQNYANWYSYNRTRMKVAKSGASSAFGDLGEDIRVGMRSLWNNSGSSNFNIPVTVDNGLFRNQTTPAVTNNRTNWYNALFSSTANNGTPLRSALRNMGTYYTDTSATGPWGPEATALQIACRQNFTILTTDGYWNGDSGFAEADGDSVSGPVITSPTGATYQYVPGRPYSSATANTLADVSMRYWKNDLRTDLPNIVPPSADDPAFWQHMVTFGLSIGLRGTLNPATDLDKPGASNDLTDGGLTWPVPAADSINNIDDLWHAAVNSQGTFVAASTPDDFSKGLRDALAAIVARTGSSSNVAANSVSVGSNTRLFQASYISGQWTGELAAYPISGTGISATASWKASALLPVHASRNIFTTTNTSGGTGGGAVFPTAAQTTALTATIASYIRGDRSLESQNAGTFRDRVQVLGDIVNSSPAFSRESNTVFVGANDGMMHAFNAATGVETFAYVPGIINLVNLKTLVNSPYDHRYLVDGPVVVSTTRQTASKNILVGTLGRGGKGLYALDVTTPASFNATKVLWEYVGDNDLGQVISRPFFTKINNGTEVIIVSNGINSTNDGAALFVINATTGALIRKIVPSGATGNNGLSEPTGVDLDFNGTTDYVYAGDLLGNVWKFDLSASNPSSWAVANSGTPLFIAKDASNNLQPISGGIGFAIDPATFNTWIYFGTGRYMTAGDPANMAVQTWYGLIDANATISGRAVLKQRKIVAAGTFAGKLVRAVEYSVAGDMAGKKGWYIDLVMPPNPPGTAQGERMIGVPIVRGDNLISSSIIPTTDACSQGGTGYINSVKAFTGAAGTIGANGSLDVNNDQNFGNDLIGGYLISSVDLGIFMPTDSLYLTPGASILDPNGCQALILAGGSRGDVAGVCGDSTLVKGRISWREIIGD